MTAYREFGVDTIIPYAASTADVVEGFASVRVKGKFGYIDKTGRIVIETQFDHANRFSEGKASITKSQKMGFIDSARRSETDTLKTQ